MAETNKSNLIKTLKGEYLKRFVVRDGSSRVIEIYEAKNDARDGEPCLKTTYSYFTGETVIEKSKEEVATWSSAYDI